MTVLGTLTTFVVCATPPLAFPFGEGGPLAVDEVFQPNLNDCLWQSIHEKQTLFNSRRLAVNSRTLPAFNSPYEQHFPCPPYERGNVSTADKGDSHVPLGAYRFAAGKISRSLEHIAPVRAYRAS